MSNRFVNVLNLNLRNSPRLLPDNIVGKLDLNQPLTVSGEPDANGWVSASSVIGGATRQGFVAAKFLREAAAPSIEALLAAARREWRRFEHGRGEEHLDPFAGFVGEMWKAIGEDLDGRDR